MRSWNETDVEDGPAGCGDCRDGAGLYWVKSRWGFTKQAAAYHWVRVQVDGKRLTATAMDIDGKMLERLEIRARPELLPPPE